MPAALAPALYQGSVSVGFAISSDGVYISNNDWTVDQLKSWATNSQPVIYYPLATPTDTEITNETLIEQLEALAAATMYNPQTNIVTLYAEGNEQPTLDVSYFTDKNPDTRDELIIDSRLRTITLNGLDVYHLQAPGSEFLMLAPGENRLALQSDITGDNGYAQVSYKQGYLSI
jgi:phage-related protein